MNILHVPIQLIEETVVELRSAGRRGEERVVLWLGSKTDSGIEIIEVFVPLQQTAADYFRIPREGMAALLKHLRETGLMIAAQVHSHPEDAFHSIADGRWAIIRHVGALSLVLPHFLLNTDRDSFVADAVVFELSPSNEWVEVPKTQILTRYSVIS